ncbi:MAG: DNA ligase D [Gemmatimonadetes bacterium]|nr:DNA ligase D [Gemmatimonadota bacterium]
MARSSPDRLSAYRAKRSPTRTPEPFSAVAATAPVSPSGGRLFVVQKHSARNLHWDFRLEWEGVLLSWAVPKGPSPNPADKRLAVRVEDHPLDYADFEGVIPEGEYGAGPVIVWDRGVWIPLDDPGQGMEKGKLLFELRGYKLRGRWTLVKTKQSPSSWLLIKERDALASKEGTASYPDDSIYAGLTVEELERVDERARELGRKLAKLGAKRRRVDPRKVEVMLATARDEPFSRVGWVFELKYDGYRLVAGREGDEAVLVSRSGGDFTETFPEVARAVRGLPYDGLVLDGEGVVHDEGGLPSFDRLQRRGLLQRRGDIARAALELPATFYAFDLLGFGDYDLRPLPLLQRKALLREVLPTIGPIRLSDHIEEKGAEMYERVCAMGLEGIVGKKADSPYRGGRSADWVKVRALQSDDFVIVGWTEPRGSRVGFGALHLAQYDAARTLVYVGSVGTGFADGQLRDLHGRLLELEQGAPPCTGEVPDGRGRGHHWVHAELVCEVRYREFTEQGLLRHAVFVRLRDDKPARECVLNAKPGHRRAPPEPAQVVERAVRKQVPFTNLDKVFWPEAGYTKGDLIEYYRSVSEWLLPYLRDRPLVLTRYPDGIHGKSFFQKNAPEWAPDWIRTVKLWSEDAQRDIEYFVCDDEESLLYVVNLGTIPLHVWSSRVSSLARPDWCILDLDPKDAPFAQVVKVARGIHALCDELELPCRVKTSGSTGLHVLIPLGRQCTYDQSRTLGELLARVLVAELPDVATIARSPRRRGGRVYIDYVQNGHGRLLVAPFSVRPVPEAAVSTPLRWSEVTGRLSIRAHTLRTVPRRMKRLGVDPLAAVLELKPDLAAALERLAARLAGANPQRMRPAQAAVTSTSSSST